MSPAAGRSEAPRCPGPALRKPWTTLTIVSVVLISAACSGGDGPGGGQSGGAPGTSGAALGVADSGSGGVPASNGGSGGGGVAGESASGRGGSVSGAAGSAGAGTGATTSRPEPNGGAAGVPSAAGAGGAVPTAGVNAGGASRGGAGGTTASGAGGSEPAVPSRGVPFSQLRPVGPPIELESLVNASDVAWKPDTDSFFVLVNRSDRFYEYSADFSIVERVIELDDAPEDAEGLAYLGSFGGVDRFAMSIESPENTVLVFDLEPGATSVDLASATRHRFEPLAPSPSNKGLEGVAYRPERGSEPPLFYVCQEGEPDQVPIRVLGFEFDSAVASSTYRDGSLVAREPWDALEALGAVAGDLSGLHYDTETDTLLVVSHLGSRVLRVSPESGEILDQLPLRDSPQYEGVTLASGGRLVVVSEPNFIEVFAPE